MALLRQALHQIDDRILHPAMVDDVVFPLRERLLGRQMTEEEQVGGLQKGGVRTELFDADAAIFENAPLAVHVADRGFCGGNSGQSGHEIVRHDVLLRLLCPRALRGCKVRRRDLAKGPPDWHTGSGHSRWMPWMRRFLPVLLTAGLLVLLLALMLLRAPGRPPAGSVSTKPVGVSTLGHGGPAPAREDRRAKDDAPGRTADHTTTR